MCLAGAISVRAVRRRLRRETWWTVHLVMYLALALSFAHVIVLGPAFVGHPLTQAVWWLVWLATAGLVLAYRIGLPVLRSLRHQLRVVEVRPEGPGVVSVTCAGRRLDRLAVSGGQFFCWRFLAPGMWWQAHPYSLSALPRPPYLRPGSRASSPSTPGRRRRSRPGRRRPPRTRQPGPRGEVLAAQSATINGVSGATYTSEGYARSLQSALDRLHA